jgi:hypothetical protein
MRRMPAPRASAAVAVVAAVVAVLAVMFPGLGFGDTTTSHGGVPSDVFMSTDPGVCNPDVDTKIGTEPVSLLPTAVTVGGESHVVAYFTSTWSGFRTDTELVLRLQISDGNEFFESSPDWSSSPGSFHLSGTVMWTFEDIQPGTYSVNAAAFLAASAAALNGNEGANLQSCALTVFVTPVAPPQPIP